MKSWFKKGRPRGQFPLGVIVRAILVLVLFEQVMSHRYTLYAAWKGAEVRLTPAPGATPQ